MPWILNISIMSQAIRPFQNDCKTQKQLFSAENFSVNILFSFENITTMKFVLMFLFVGLISQSSQANTDHSFTKKPATINPNTGYLEQQITAHFLVLKAPRYNTNVGVYIGEEAIVLVDPMTGFKDQDNLLKAIKYHSNKPIKYVLNTHSHPDHSGANDFFMALGATVISQHNARYTPASHDVTFDASHTLELEDETITLHHIAAHTFDDALIHFEKANVIMLGDTFMTNSYPHFYYGGGADGHQNILTKALSLGDDKSHIIPAHGQLKSDKQALQKYLTDSQRWVQTIKDRHQAGHSLETISQDLGIIELSNTFNDNNAVSVQRLQQNIAKVIATDFIAQVPVNKVQLLTFSGMYQYPDGQTDEVLIQDDNLIIRSPKKYMYELVPIDEHCFQIRGQMPPKYITFNPELNNLSFETDKSQRIATKQP